MTDILIVGAGPSGLILAAELARFGVDFRIIDSGRAPTDLSKAIGVQPRTLETFEIMGIADNLIPHGNPARAFNLYDRAERIVRFDFQSIDSKYPYILIVPQSETERVLLEKFTEYGKQIERNTILKSFIKGSAGVSAHVTHADGSEETILAKWLIGCDGAHSAVRHGLGFKFVGEEYHEGFMLADVGIEWEQPSDEVFLFLRDGTLFAIFPLPGGHCRIIADIPPDQALTDNPTLEDCQRLADERSPFPITFTETRWTSNYRIHRRIVSKLREGRVFLVGDAAHIHSPAGAQGMNTGIQDAFNLAWKLALVTKGKASDDLLDSYNTERYPVEHAVLQITDAMLKMASLKQPIAAQLRDSLLSWISSTDIFQKKASGIISETSVGYRGSPICIALDSKGDIHAGDRAPNVLIGKNGEPKPLSELLRSGKFLMLNFAGKGDEAGEKLLDAAGTLDPALRDMTEILAIPSDSNVELRAAFGIDHACTRIVRPDGYVGLCADLQYIDEALSKWQRIFGES